MACERERQAGHRRRDQQNLLADCPSGIAGMTPAGRARVLACFANPIEISLTGDSLNADGPSYSARSRNLPQMPQLPQFQAPAPTALTDREAAFEERAAIMEYDGGLPRSLAEFLARRCDDRGRGDRS